MINHKKPIPDDALADYIARKITSQQLADLTGHHPSYLRRAIKRPPKQPQPKTKTKLIQARQAYRASIAHLPIREIAQQAYVSLSTAARIKNKYGKTP